MQTLSSLSLVSDADLARMQTRAYREAARSWAEWREYRTSTIAAMLHASALDADAFYADVKRETERRERVA